MSINILPKGTGNVNIMTNSSAEGGLLLYENSDDTGYHVGLKAPGGLTKSSIYSLPSTDGTNGQYLKTNGSGVLSFSSVSGISGSGSGTELQYRSGSSTFGAVTNSSVSGGVITIGSGNPLQFADSGEYISGDGTVLTIGSSNDINLIPTNNVTIPNEKNLVFGTGENGSDKYIRSNDNTNLVLGSASTGNVVINNGGLVLSHETIEDASLSISNSAPTIKAVTKAVTYYYVAGSTNRFTNIGGNPCSNGSVWHVLFERDSSAQLRIDFGINGLMSGSGSNQYLTLDGNGQSASMIYMNSLWRIINTGGTVS